MLSATIAGNLGRDAQIKELPSGAKVTEFTVAINRGYGDQQRVVWARCSMFGQRGEKLAQYLTKGSKVCVSGQGDVRAWSDDGGNARASFELRVDDVTLQGGGADPGSHPATTASSQPAAASAAPAASGAGVDDFNNDDIPF